RADDLGRAAGLLDLFLGRRRERRGLHRERLLEIALTEDLDAVASALEEARQTKRHLVDDRARVEAVEVAHVDGEDHLGDRVLDATLGEAADERGLTTREAQIAEAAGMTGLLTLHALAGRLAEARAHAAALAPLALDRTDGRMETRKDRRLLFFCVSHRLPPRRRGE